MFENQQIAAIIERCPRFRNSSKNLKTHCAANTGNLRCYCTMYMNGRESKIGSVHTHVITYWNRKFVLGLKKQKVEKNKFQNQLDVFLLLTEDPNLFGLVFIESVFVSRNMRN